MGLLNLWRGRRSPDLMRESRESASVGFPRTLWGEPFLAEVERTFNELERLLAPWRSSFGFGSDEEAALSVNCDVEETESNYILHVDVPGVHREDLNIELQGNRLMVSGERKREHELQRGGIQRLEKRFGRFQRMFTLPDGTNVDSIKAGFENGVLSIIIPKSEQMKAQKISIEQGKGEFTERVEAEQAGQQRQANEQPSEEKRVG